MKLGEHDLLSANGLLVIKRLDNKSVILLTNYLSAKATQQIDWRVKGSKEKIKVSCPSVVPEYNQFMGGVKLCDQMKLEYKVGHRIKFCFHSRVFFEFFWHYYLKIDSTPPLSTMDFRCSVTQKTIFNFSKQEKSNINFQTNEAIDWRINWYCQSSTWLFHILSSLCIMC